MRGNRWTAKLIIRVKSVIDGVGWEEIWKWGEFKRKNDKINKIKRCLRGWKEERGETELP